MVKNRWFACLSVLLVISPTAHADSWQGQLKGGGVVDVDPYTHKPTVNYQGRSTQLWNGVHEMSDGSVIIVRDGVAVPDERMINSWAARSQLPSSAQTVHCEELVRKACGFNNECSGSGPCTTARQLHALELDELRQAPYGQVSASALECESGLVDATLFPPCKAAMQAGRTPCGKLVKKVCGADRQCAQAEDCRLADQLLDMENEERMIAADPNARTATEQQCKQAMSEDILKACGE
jgi:hypothetical protein